MNILKNIRAWQWTLIVALAGLSIVTWYFLYSEHLTLVYNDAKSYLNISRSVLDSQQPGLAQIGSVWLPFVHILKLPFIWSEWMWHSGFAGSMLSMFSYVLAVVGVAGIVWRLTKSQLAAGIGGLVAALNVNFLYLQSTPLTEPLYLMLLVWSVFFLVLYAQSSSPKYLLPLAGLTALQCLTRYDGWFVAVVLALIILGYELWIRRATLEKALGHVMLFAAPVIFACLLWFGWNAVIFGDPFYFISGPGSAHAQQTVIEQQSGLVTKGSFLTSLKAYGFAAVGNVGWWIFTVSLAGWAAFLAASKRREWRLPLAVLIALGAVFVFNVLALFLGFSSINVPQLGWDTSNTVDPLFNVRYGLLMLPLAAVGVGLLVAKWRVATALVIGLVVFQGVAMIQEKPITLRDGQTGASAFMQHALAEQMRQHIGTSDEVLLSMSVFNPLAFESGLALKQIVHEGIQDRWQTTLAHPENSVPWIVMGVSSADPVYTALHDSPTIHNNYQKIYQDQFGTLYKRLEPTR